MAENKTKTTGASVTEFIAGVEDEVKRRDAKALIDLMRRVTGEKPKMWGPSIVGFGSHHYRYETGREGDMPIVGFSPRKAGLVLYGTIGFSGALELLSRLGKHTTGKGCLYVKRMSDIDAGVLKELIEGSVAARDRR
ncbi:MAG TPA: DUF1801 domain-containing protein [Bryobacteraceae bacterium]|nr:DUF1801 domain-containing protein [Bryobacteraceae bacterium]